MCTCLGRWCGVPVVHRRSARFLAAQPEAYQNQVLDLLFDKATGLGLDIVRYTIPASYNPGRQKRRPLFKKYISQGFLAYKPLDVEDVSTWRFDWTQDAEQRRVLLAAKQRGVKEIEAISYSPPWWLTTNADVTGAASPCRGGCAAIVPNLLPPNYRG